MLENKRKFSGKNLYKLTKTLVATMRRLKALPNYLWLVATIFAFGINEAMPRFNPIIPYALSISLGAFFVITEYLLYINKKGIFLILFSAFLFWYFFTGAEVNTDYIFSIVFLIFPLKYVLERKNLDFKLEGFPNKVRQSFLLWIVVIMLGTFLGGYKLFQSATHKTQVEKILETTPSPSPTSTPTSTPAPQVKVNQIAPTPYDPIVDCIGPDGKHSQKTQKECDDFNAAWRKPQQANRNNVPNNQSGTVNCQTKSGWVSVTKEDCVRLQDEWKQDILKDVIRQQDQQLNIVLALEREAYAANTLDQLDNIRERLRWIKTSDSYAQDYINSVIGYIEARIKILQQR